jgi:hypothetical protein
MPLPSIEIQDRDLTLLAALVECRVMTLAHIAALHFEGRREAAKKRVYLLKTAGFIGERRRRPYEPAVLFPSRIAWELLSEHGLLSGYPDLSPAQFEKRTRVSDLTLRHELEVLDCKAAIYSAVMSSSRFSITEFSTWPALFQFHAAPATGMSDVLVKPDGFLRVLETEADGGLSEHAFFLEVDRSTETQDTLGHKASCYVDFYRRGGFAECHGHAPSEYKEFPFRVLMVFKSQERRNNATERLLANSPPIQTQVWLTTVEELIDDPLGPIWVQPLDYLRVTTGTAYEPGGHTRSRQYVRQAGRESLVNDAISKRRLLDAPVS